MNLYKRFGMIALLICLAGTTFAIDVPGFGDLETILNDYLNGKPPEREKEFLNELLTMYKNGELTSQFEGRIFTESEIKEAIINFMKGEFIGAYTHPRNLIQSFADASVYASHSASHRANQNYKDFAFTIGAMAGFRLPGGIMNPVDDIVNAGKAISDEHDIMVGANVQAVTAQFGINTSSFLLDGLYLGLRYSYLLSLNVEDFSLTAYTVGLVAHYQLIKGVDAGNGWHHGWTWRGLTVGTGLLFSRTTLNYTGSLKLDLPTYGFGLDKTKLDLELDVITYTVPLEIYTSALMLWCINVHFGFGVDLAFGKNTSTLGVSTEAYYNDPITNTPEKLDDIHATGSVSMSPSLLNPRITLGLGLRFGAVTLDVPINYYFHLEGSGLSAGLTLGVAL